MSSNYKLVTGGGLKQGVEPLDIITRYEQIPTMVCQSAEVGSHYVARQVAKAIQAKTLKGEKFVLGLSTGKSPVDVYRELVRMHREESLSFKNVVMFSLDEFYPVNASEDHSRSRAMREELLKHIDVEENNVHLLHGDVPLDEVSTFCKHYEEKIAEEGGIDLMLLGIGTEGQIGFNEPGTFVNTKTRLVALSNNTRKVIANDMLTGNKVPSRAITMGISTIRSARRVLMFAWSEEKSKVLERVVEGPIDASVPASFLQRHENAEFVVSEDVAVELTRFKKPWLVGTCEWTDKFIRKAVLWLCEKVDKPILKLTYQDYIDNSLGQLLDEVGDYYTVNIRVFNELQHTITGWPGGKPNADDSTRPERSTPYPKRVLIFSPHPDDDVISMGGTFIRLSDQGHDVHVAYETSGNIAVHDDVVLQILDTARQCGLGDEYDRIKAIIDGKKPGEREPRELLNLKGAIRRGEARAADRFIGLDENTHVHFLNLPFYETGTVKKNGVGQEDIDIIIKLLRDIKPHQIYAAGDLSDPHGTHRVCIEAVLGAIKQIQSDEWLKDCRLWLYRGAWQEWELDMVDMAVPLSPDEVIRKRHAIYRHLSQKDIVPFPGDDKREFWQRAEDRTQATAKRYNKLGMAEYEAIEVFVQYDIFR